jgi:hypothetical protein
MKNGAFHAWHELDNTCIADVLDQPVDDRVAQLAVGHLTAAEAQASLDLVALGEEANRLILLGLVVVIVHGDGELALLDRDHLLLLLGGAITLFLLVEEAPIVLNAADRGNRVGRDLNQIQAAFTGNPQRLKRRKNSKLFAVFVDDADFARTNFLVDADKGLGRTFIECDGAPPKVASARLPESAGVHAGTRAHPEYSIGPVHLNKGFMVIFHLSSEKLEVGQRWRGISGKKGRILASSNSGFLA